MKIFVTGASSEIGKKLVAQLAHLGHQMTCLSRDPTYECEHATVVCGNLLDTASWQDHLAHMDAVLHVAGVTHSDDPQAYYRVNTEAGFQLLLQAQKQGARRFVFISTRAVGPSGGAYADSKYRMEQFLMASELDWVILRPAEVYGIGKEEGINALIEMVRNKRFLPMAGRGSYTVAPVHLDDVVQAIVATFSAPGVNRVTFTLCGPESFSMRDFIRFLCHHYGLKRVLVPIPLPLLRLIVACKSFLPLPFNITPDQIPRLLLDKQTDWIPAREALGFVPASIRDRLPGGPV